MSGSRWPCVYPHLWNAYVWRRQRRKRARAKCWIIEELGRGRQNRLNEGQGKRRVREKSQGIFQPKSVRNIWYTLQILTNTLLTLNNAERQWIFSSKHIMSPVTRWLHKKTKTKTQHYNIQSLEMVTTKYEASAWQQSTENRTEQSARRGYKQATFFIKEQSWRKLNLPVSIAMWMQDKWREERHERSNKTRREHAKEEREHQYGRLLMRRRVFQNLKKKRTQMAAEEVAGTVSSDMDPQDLPTETATFRGTWGTHEGKKKWNLRRDNATWPWHSNQSILAIGGQSVGMQRKDPILSDGK